MWPSRIICSMSFHRLTGVSRQQWISGGLGRGTSLSSTMFLIILWATMRPLLSTQLISLLMRRLLFRSSRRDSSRPTQVIGNITAKVESPFQYPEPHSYYHSVLMSIVEDYRMIQEGSVPRMRTRRDDRWQCHSPKQYDLFLVFLRHLYIFIFFMTFWRILM